MTAEIAIINKHAVAIAADSAITIGKKKVWKNTDKIFSLSPYNDIAIMIYGNSSFLGYPLETIISNFKSSIKNIEFNSVNDCVVSFKAHLEKYCSKDNENTQDFFIMCLDDCIRRISPKDKLKSKLQAKIILQDKLDAIYDSLEEFEDIYDSGNECADFDKDELKQYIKSEVGINISKAVSEKIIRTASKALSKKVDLFGTHTGLVFTGIGKNEDFPSIYSCKLDGHTLNRPRMWLMRTNKKESAISEPTTSIVTFAQSDVAKIFMEGISTEIKEYIFEQFEKHLEKISEKRITRTIPDPDEQLVEALLQYDENLKILNSIRKKVNSHIYKNQIEPVINVVENIPKEEMGMMAEALVEITSLRRKVDSHLETVGGPIDVLVISKLDGLIWLKKKQYINPDMNPDYIKRLKNLYG